MFYSTDRTILQSEDDCLLDADQDTQLDQNGDCQLLRLRRNSDEEDELLKLEKELQRQEDELNRGCVERILDVVSVFLVRIPHPYVPGSLLILVGLLALFLGVGYTSYKHHPPQDFIDAIMDDATVGFQTRGTYIKRGQATAKQLFDEVLGNKPSKYAVIPNSTLALKQLGASDQTLAYLNLLSKGNQQQSDSSEGDSHSTSRRQRRQAPNDTAYCETQICESKGANGGGREEYIPVGAPDMYFLFVLEAESGDLYTEDRMKSVCTLEESKLLPMFGYKTGCTMCGLPVARSLPQTIATYLQKDCQHLTSDDLHQFRTFLNTCLHSLAPLLAKRRDGTDTGGNLNMRDDDTITTTTTQSPDTPDIPKECLTWQELVLDVKYFFVDKQFTTDLSGANPLTYTIVFVQSGAYTEDPLTFYHKEIEDAPRIGVNDDDVYVTAFGVGRESIKWDLFQEYFLSDTLWFGLAMGLVFIVMFLYLRRIDLVLATIISVAFGFIFAYAIYYFVLKMKFFPFINLLGLLVLIAVGADDVFVFFDIYQQIRTANPDLPLEKVISRTLSHAALSVFVTSLTTAAAFFANAVSSITAIKVFGIFAGTAILVNFFVMVLVVPCLIILVEKFLTFFRRFLVSFCSCGPTAVKAIFCECQDNRLMVFSRKIFDVYFPRLIDRTWYVWLPLLSILSILAGMVVFAYPKFELPNTKDFQLFRTSNLLENWFFNVQRNFYFVEDEGNVPMVTAAYVFGFHAEDGGNHWDPSSHTTRLVEDKSFNFYDPEIQTWLSDFCEKQKGADYVPGRFRDYTCNFEAYAATVQAVCGNNIPTELSNYVPMIEECCATSSVPFNATQLQDCIPIYMAVLFNDLPPVLSIPRPHVGQRLIGDLIFEKSTNLVKGYLLYVVTDWPYTFNYDDMQGHYNTLAGDFIKQLKSAPRGLHSGFVGFNRDFYFYDLQHSLATGAYYSVALSLGVAFLVMLFTSLNVLITVYAMVTITLAIVCTIATIVLLGWHLNVIEAVIISLSVGLSIDFTIHYGVAYRLSEAKKPQLRVHDSFHKVGGAVAMAALTTFLAGAGLMPCRVLPYIKLGIFLMLVMLFAWLYANLFFQSLCRVIGPRANFCQISALCAGRRRKKEVEDREDDHPGSGTEPDRMRLNSVEDDDSLLVTF